MSRPDARHIVVHSQTVREDQLDKMNKAREGICWGLRPGNSGTQFDRPPDTIGSADAGTLRNPADPQGWHAFPESTGPSFRRARRIAQNGGVAHIMRDQGVDFGFAGFAIERFGGTLDGVRVARAETVRTMMSNLLPAGVTFGGIGGGTGGTNAPIPMGFGAGGSVYLADGPGGFPSRGTYGWGGAAGTIAFVDPVRRFRATVMVNYMPPEKWPLRVELARALGQDAARLAR